MTFGLAHLSLALQLHAQSAQFLSTATFEEFTVAFGKEYEPGSSEYAMRKGIFEHHAAQVQMHNAKAGSLWRAGLNEFTDWTPTELGALKGLRGVRGGGAGGKRARSFLDTREPVPDTVDWSHLATLQRAPNQGSCGSCWAFASASMLDAAYEIVTNDVKKFSPQQFVDCVENPDECGGSGGCMGATVELAMEYAKTQGLPNLQVRKDYRYTARDGSCPDHLTSLLGGSASGHDMAAQRYVLGDAPEVELLSYQTLAMNEVEPLMRALTQGPVAVAAAANTWTYYARGVYDGCTESNDWVVNHAVIAIGYGEERGTKYWTIQNSWGQSWGEDGKIRLQRADTKEPCGVDDRPEDGVECKPYPDSVKTCGQCGVLYDSVAVILGLRS